MSEFKFACPVCGQHITADSGVSGAELNCPTCFQRIVVPQAPALNETKFILTASQVTKPRPNAIPAPANLEPLQPKRASSLVGTISLLVCLGTLGLVLYIFRETIVDGVKAILGGR